MGDSCPPLRLPIHVETSCSTTQSCGGCKPPPVDNCSTNCVVDTAINFQGSYQNRCCPTIGEPTAVVTIAYLSNVRNDECQPDFAVTLNTVCLEWCEFIRLFYRANNSFSILPIAGNTCAINFAGQTYENTTNQKLHLNIAQLTRQAWANKCQTTVDKVPPKTNIILNRDSSYIKSLLVSSTAITLSLDEAIETLLNNGEIAPADSTSSAVAQFGIQYNYTFQPLNVTTQINFVYKTKIPCYRNVNFCEEWCPPYSYSKDYNCRTCQNLKADVNVYENYDKLKENFESELQNDESSHQDSNSNYEMESDFLGELKDLSKGNDDKTCFSLDSSKW